jgi:hypothetical protein
MAVKLHPGLYDAVNRTAHIQKVNMSDVVRAALSTYISSQADLPMEIRDQAAKCSRVNPIGKATKGRPLVDHWVAPAEGEKPAVNANPASVGG